MDRGQLRLELSLDREVIQTFGLSFPNHLSCSIELRKVEAVLVGRKAEHSDPAYETHDRQNGQKANPLPGYVPSL
jgi:hypothetical protein